MVRSAGRGHYTKLRGAIATGIRPPDGFELAFTDNPALKPECSFSTEAAIEHAFAGGRGQLEAVAFYNEYDDLIVTVGSFQDSSRFQTDNIANARARGIELGLTGRHRLNAPLAIDVHGRGYTFMDTDILAVDGDDAAPPPFEVGDPLLRRPRHQLSLEAGMSAGRLTAFVTGRGRGRALDVEPSSGTFAGLFFADGFNVWDAGAAWRLHRTLDVFGRIENIAGRDYEEALGFPALGRRATSVSGLLRAADVTFGYRDRPVVRNVSLDVADDGFVGIIGPNGSGKTTLLRLLAGTRSPARGSVTLDGVPLRTLPRAQVAQRMAVVPQETQLAFEYTVLEVVLMGRYPHLGPFALEGPADIVVAREALRATGTLDLSRARFPPLAAVRSSASSSPPRWRRSPRGRLCRPESRPDRRPDSRPDARILLLDEPTAALDLKYQLEVASLLTSLHKTHDLAVVVSTHDLNFAAGLCQTLVMLKEGRVLATGPVDEVLTPARIRELYEVEAEVVRHPRSGHLRVTPLGRDEHR